MHSSFNNKIKDTCSVCHQNEWQLMSLHTVAGHIKTIFDIQPSTNSNGKCCTRCWFYLRLLATNDNLTKQCLCNFEQQDKEMLKSHMNEIMFKYNEYFQNNCINFKKNTTNTVPKSYHIPHEAKIDTKFFRSSVRLLKLTNHVSDEKIRTSARLQINGTETIKIIHTNLYQPKGILIDKKNHNHRSLEQKHVHWSNNMITFILTSESDTDTDDTMPKRKKIKLHHEPHPRKLSPIKCNELNTNKLITPININILDDDKNEKTEQSSNTINDQPSNVIDQNEKISPFLLNDLNKNENQRNHVSYDDDDDDDEDRPISNLSSNNLNKDNEMDVTSNNGNNGISHLTQTNVSSETSSNELYKLPTQIKNILKSSTSQSIHKKFLIKKFGPYFFQARVQIKPFKTIDLINAGLLTDQIQQKEILTINGETLNNKLLTNVENNDKSMTLNDHQLKINDDNECGSIPNPNIDEFLNFNTIQNKSIISDANKANIIVEKYVVSNFDEVKHNAYPNEVNEIKEKDVVINFDEVKDNAHPNKANEAVINLDEEENNSHPNEVNEIKEKDVVINLDKTKDNPHPNKVNEAVINPDEEENNPHPNEVNEIKENDVVINFAEVKDNPHLSEVNEIIEKDVINLDETKDNPHPNKVNEAVIHLDEVKDNPHPNEVNEIKENDVVINLDEVKDNPHLSEVNEIIEKDVINLDKTKKNPHPNKVNEAVIHLDEVKDNPHPNEVNEIKEKDVVINLDEVKIDTHPNQIIKQAKDNITTELENSNSILNKSIIVHHTNDQDDMLLFKQVEDTVISLFEDDNHDVIDADSIIVENLLMKLPKTADYDKNPIEVIDAPNVDKKQEIDEQKNNVTNKEVDTEFILINNKITEIENNAIPEISGLSELVDFFDITDEKIDENSKIVDQSFSRENNQNKQNIEINDDVTINSYIEEKISNDSTQSYGKNTNVKKSDTDNVENNICEEQQRSLLDSVISNLSTVNEKCESSLITVELNVSNNINDEKQFNDVSIEKLVKGLEPDFTQT